jgi:hypothetical protein
MKQLPVTATCGMLKDMSAGRLNEQTLRPGEHLLVWAFIFSLAAHVLFFGGFRYGNRHGWWNHNLMPNWLKTTKQALAEVQKKQAARLAQPQPQEVPLMFVDVDPAAVTPEPPKNAKYYSSRNSQAANPDPAIDTETPKINGSQTHVAKTQDASRTKTSPLQPTPQPATPANQAEALPKPKGGPQIGDLAMAKPATQPGEGHAESDNGHAEAPAHQRPRTLAEAKLQQTLAGQKMKQDGGVKRNLVVPSLDTISTPYGEYDRELVEAIQNRWFDLLDSKEFSRDGTGRVVIQFRLNSDGRITNVKIAENDVGDLLGYVCQRAITDPAPFARWPTDMRRLIGADYRDVTFTFYYE